MAEPLTFAQIMSALNNNPQFHDPNAYGPRNEPPLLPKEKSQICGIITKDMKECLEANGDEFFAEIWRWIKPELGKVNWFQRHWGGKKKDELLGPFIIWRMVYKKASKLTEIIIKEKQPKTIHEAAIDATHEAMQEALKKSGALDLFEKE